MFSISSCIYITYRKYHAFPSIKLDSLKANLKKKKIPLALVFLLATPPGPSVDIYKMKIGYKQNIKVIKK